MRPKIWICIGIILSAVGCSEHKTTSDEASAATNNQSNQRVTYVGIAVTGKDKPYIDTGEGIMYVDLPHYVWFDNGVNGKKVRVTGTIGTYMLPVFIPQLGEPQKQGIPMPPGTDLEKAGKTTILCNVTWTRVE